MRTIVKKKIKNNAYVIWFTGLSGSGKTTLANLLAKWLRKREIDLEFLDGEFFRDPLYLGLGYSIKEREIKSKKIGYVVDLLNKHGVWVVVASITAYRKDRDRIRKLIGKNFVEVYVKCPFEIVKKRDTKGFYKKVAMGLEKNFSGIDSPYEPPILPEIEVETGSQSIDESFKIIEDYMKKVIKL